MSKRLLLAAVAFAVIAFALWRLLHGTQGSTVVVYVSHDQVLSEPILKDFEKETGSYVRAVYDTEETKSTGAMKADLTFACRYSAARTSIWRSSTIGTCLPERSVPLTRRSKSSHTAGSRNSVSAVDVMRPPITTVAS